MGPEEIGSVWSVLDQALLGNGPTAISEYQAFLLPVADGTFPVPFAFVVTMGSCRPFLFLRMTILLQFKFPGVALVALILYCKYLHNLEMR